MEVLEAPDWWVFTCRACKAKCKAEPKDVIGRPNPDADGDVLTYTPVVKCGRCGEQRKVPEKLVSEEILKTARRKGSRRRRF